MARNELNVKDANDMFNEMSISTFLDYPTVKQKLQSVIGRGAAQFASSLVSAVNANQELNQCTRNSLLNAALLGQALKLSPSPQLGHFYMVPFKDRKTDESNAQFILGYKGYIQLAIRSGQYRNINVLPIKEGELQSYDPLTEKISVRLIEDAEAREQAETIGYFARFELVNGFEKALYWSKSKMVEHAKKYSPGYKNDLQKKTTFTFWSKDFDAMALKTMIRQLISKWGIMSIDMQDANAKDGGVIDEDLNATFDGPTLNAEIRGKANTEVIETLPVAEPEAEPEQASSQPSFDDVADF